MANLLSEQAKILFLMQDILLGKKVFKESVSQWVGTHYKWIWWCLTNDSTMWAQTQLATKWGFAMREGGRDSSG